MDLLTQSSGSQSNPPEGGKDAAGTDQGQISPGWILVGLLLATALMLIIVGFTVWHSFHETISEEFLLLYFGIASGLSVGVWSTLMLVDHPDRRSVFIVHLHFSISAFAAVVAVVLGPARAVISIDVSLTFMVAGLSWLLFQSAAHLYSRDSSWRHTG